MQVLDVCVSLGHSGSEVEFLLVLSSSSSLNHSVSVEVSLYAVQCNGYMLLVDCLCVCFCLGVGLDMVMGWWFLYVLFLTEY